MIMIMIMIMIIIIIIIIIIITIVITVFVNRKTLSLWKNEDLLLIFWFRFVLLANPSGW